jgi:hypothetical protein
MVNTLYIESRFKQIANLNVVNNVLWLRNSQSKDEFEDGTVQQSGVQSQLTMINKLDYTISAGNLTIRPMFKHLLLRQFSDIQERATGDGAVRSTSTWAPLLRTRYDLTPKSNLQLGFQGFPFWRHNHTDRVQDQEGFSEWTLVLMMTNRSDHYGYNLSSQFGFIRTDREFDDKTRAADSFDNSRLFFDIVAGF